MTDTLIPVLILALINTLATALLLWHHHRQIKSRDRQIKRQCELLARAYTDLAEARFNLDEQRLAFAVRRFGRLVEYEYIGTDSRAADRGYRVFVN